MSDATHVDMHISIRTGTCIAGALALAIATAACGDNNNPNDVQGAIDIGEQRGQVLATQTTTDLGSDTPEVALGKAGQIMLTIDDGEIMQAQLVVDAGVSDPAVLDFANRMITEHTAHRDATLNLIEASKVTPIESDVSSLIQSDAMQGLRELEDASSGDLDRTYMRLQVTMHAEASVIVGALQDLAPAPDIAAFIADTQAQIDAHRVDAADLLRQL
jgi:predicted outer membrane protein